MELTSDLNEEFIDVPDIAEPPPASAADFEHRPDRIFDTSIGSLHRRQGFLAPRVSLLRLESSG